MQNSKFIQPLDPHRAADVRSRLDDILQSEAFREGKRSQEFLQVIVEHALAGRIENLRERSLGVELFGRPANYDSSNDAVVRVKANDVRKRLAVYYLNLPERPQVRIDLPAGSYIPQFSFAPVPVAPSEAELTPDPAVSDSKPLLSSTQSKPNQSLAKPKPDRVHTVSLLATFVLVLIGLVTFLELKRHASQPVNIHSIAILPLANFSGDPAQDYLADGMTDELTADLGQISSLRVVSRTSTMTFKNSKKTLPEIAKELNVAALLEGSVKREGDNIRVVIRLIDCRTDRSLWAHTFNQNTTSILQLQNDVAHAVVEQIQTELKPDERARLNRVRQVDPVAIDLYLQGRHNVDIADPKSAFENFKESVQKDPDYAPAHAALADIYGWMGEGGWLPYAEAFSQQKNEALKAISLDDVRAEPHLALASAAMDQSWDWTKQESELKRAFELSPNSTAVVTAYANYLMHLNHCNEAEDKSQIALNLDPLSSSAYLGASFISYFCRHYDVAFAQTQQDEQFPHRYDENYFPRGVIEIEQGHYRDGVEQLRKIGDFPHALGHMGNAYARQGNIPAAMDIVAKLKQHIEKNGIGRYEVALVYAGSRQNDEAFKWLEEAFQVHDKGLTYLRVDPCLDPLRGDPRFADLVKRVGIPE